MRQYATTFVFALIMFLSGLHTFFPDTVESVQAWQYYHKQPMTLAWNIRYLSDQVIWILYPLCALFWVNNRINRTTAKCFFLFAVMDAGMYFYNYKTTDYGLVYFWYIGFWLFIHYSAWLWRRLKYSNKK